MTGCVGTFRSTPRMLCACFSAKRQVYWMQENTMECIPTLRQFGTEIRWTSINRRGGTRSYGMRRIPLAGHTGVGSHLGVSPK